MDKTFSSLEKAIDILNYFYSENRALSAQEMSSQLSIPRSTTYKYLDVLLKRGFLSKNPDT